MVKLTGLSYLVSKTTQTLMLSPLDLRIIVQPKVQTESNGFGDYGDSYHLHPMCMTMAPGWLYPPHSPMLKS
jgi:hypothetical protein